MKLFNTSHARSQATTQAQVNDVQAAPQAVGSGKDLPKQQLKVDAAYRLNDTVIVAGWCTGKLDLYLVSGGGELATRRVTLPRPDVAAHLQLDSGDGLGFALVTHVQGTASVDLAWTTQDDNTSKGVFPVKFTLTTTAAKADLQALGPALGLLAQAQKLHTKDWDELIGLTPLATTPCRLAHGFFEVACACEQTGDAVVVGWCVSQPGTHVWLEDDSGKTFPLDQAFRRFRQDVHDAVGGEFGHASREAGFIANITGTKPGTLLRLKAVGETGIHVLSEIGCTALPIDPVGAARWLFGIGTPISDMHRRVPLIDEPLLSPLIKHRLSIWDTLPVQTRDLGKLPQKPAISVIVPLYGRMDFVEHQLIEFSTDPWFNDNAELIYVIDDPKLLETFPPAAEALFRLYRIPMRWVWGSVNRGYSGANNLGVAHSHAPKLLFLNSDAFPQKAGWLQGLLDVLDTHPEVGAVGPRLVFADGSIQHAGMEFMRREELGIWINHHPHMGLDPMLDPARGITIVPSVTGACLALRRSDFERVGGWDTGYLIGDFEDSDLCLKLRADGMQIAYLPEVQLTHLERQSFKLLGQDEFRTRVVIYNAVRHQTRWADLISQPLADPIIATA